MPPVTPPADKDLASDDQEIRAKEAYNKKNKTWFGRKSGLLTNVALPILSGFVVWWNKTPPSVSTSMTAPTKAFQTCLTSACSGFQVKDCVRFSGIGKDEDEKFFDWVIPYNRAWPWVPTAVVQPNSTEQVSAFVKCAADNNIKVQAKSGGHSYANYGLGGQNGALSIDLRQMMYVIVNETSWVATIGGGSLLGGIDAMLEEKGRMFPHGVCPGVGIGGHATIGGLGPSSRMLGATLDHVVGVEMVVANGSIVIADDTTNGDLFFAVRGGGSGFGIITEFKIRTHEAPQTVLRITSRTPYTQSDLIVDQFLNWLDLTADPDLDPRLGTEYALEPSGSKITATWFGTKEEFERSGIMKRLPSGLTLVESEWGETARWVWENAKLYLADVPTEFFSRSLGFREDNVFSREAATELVNMFKTNKNRIDSNWFVIFDATGGEVAKPAMNSTAYAHRDKVRFYQSYGFNVMSPLSELTRNYFNTTHQFILDNTGRPNTTYAGYADPYLANPQEAYWGSNLARLQEIKLAWDPKDVFHNPQTVQPSSPKI